MGKQLLITRLSSRMAIPDSPAFPIRISSRTYSCNADVWHQHEDFIELVLCIAGSARNDMMDGGSFVLHTGQLLVFPEGYLHRYSKIKQFYHYNILFTKDVIQSISQYTGMPKDFLGHFGSFQQFLLSPELLNEAVRILETMRLEYLSRSQGWGAVIYGLLCQFLVLLWRDPIQQQSAHRNSGKILQIVIKNISEDCSRNWTLASMAKQSNLSVSAFRHTFQSQTGMPPLKYLLQQRIRKGMIMLASNYLLADVAAQTGFHDINYFCRQFKRICNTSPLKFQKDIQTGVRKLSDELIRLQS